MNTPTSSIDHDLALQETHRLMVSDSGVSKALRRVQFAIAGGLLVASTATTLCVVLTMRL